MKSSLAARASFLACLGILFMAGSAHAQTYCTFVPVGQPLTDLGMGEYNRLNSTNTLTYVPTGYIGGLYPGGSNFRPPAHESAGMNIASQIQPLDANGNPSPSGKIGFVSSGMSNAGMEFSTFMQLANADTEVNDDLRIANAAISGATIDHWTNQSHPAYNITWEMFMNRISQSGLTPAQVQVVWAKNSIGGQKQPFPQHAQTLSAKFEALARELKSRLPNLKITYFSSRTRSFGYIQNLLMEPNSFENGFAIRFMLEKQINGDPALNYDPSLGPTPVSYLSWGPYLWVDGPTPRLDGHIWPMNYTQSDCIHPTAAGQAEAADMMMEFFKTDTTATPWFLDEPPVPDITPPVISGIMASPYPTSVDVAWTTDEPANGQIEFVEPCPSWGCFAQIVQAYTTSHAFYITGLLENTFYAYRVLSQDPAGNPAQSGYYDFTTPIQPPDTTPPSLSGWQPSGMLPAGTTSTTMQVETDEAATCRYSDTPGIEYQLMANVFENTGSISHSSLVGPLQDGQTYFYYVRCQDAEGNVNTEDYAVSFSVDDPSTLPQPISAWGFASDLVTDDINGCTGCANNGASWFTPSVVSGGYQFNGASSNINLGTFPYLDGKRTFTVSVWIKPNFDQNHGSIRTVFVDGPNIVINYLYTIHDWRVVVRNSQGATYRLDTMGLSWTPDTWHLITVTYDGAALKVYWDGALSNSVQVSGALASMGYATLLGSSPGNWYFDGSIDELRIYDYALSQQEISQIYLEDA